MSEKSRAYLDILQADPTLPAVAIAAKLGVHRNTVTQYWRKKVPGFREAERAIRARHKLLMRRADLAEPLPEPEPEVSGGDPRLLRWLELYEQCDDRVEALDACKAEGLELSLEDIEIAVETDPDFRKRFMEHWRRGVVKTEDHVRRRAAEGKKDFALPLLRAEMPLKWAPTVRHQHGGRVQLQTSDQRLVEEMKVRALPAPVIDVEAEEVPS